MKVIRPRRSAEPVVLGEELGLVLSLHGVVERIEHPEIQLNHLDLETFERVVELVRTRFSVVSLDEIVASLRGGGPLPARAVALTFDDGYRSMLDIVDPILAAHGLPYAVFVPAGLVGSGERLPTYVMRAALTFTRRREIRLPGRRKALPLRTAAERSAAVGVAAALLRSSPQPVVHEATAELRALLSPDEWEEVDRRFESEALMGWDELARLARRRVTVGSHTHGHAVLHTRQSAEEIGTQVRASKAEIEERLGVPCRHFCYPQGRRGDVCPAAVRAVRDAGYAAGLMNIGGQVRTGMDPLLLPRLYVSQRFGADAVAPHALARRSKWFATFTAELDPGG